MEEDAKKRQQKLREIVDDLKKEIFVELDRRIRETEESLSGKINKRVEKAGEQIGEELGEQIVEQIEEQIEEQVGERVEEQVVGELEKVVKRQIKSVQSFKKVNKRVREDFSNFQENLQLYHKIPYAIMVVMGFLLFWYGAWSTIRVIPLLNNGAIALAAGAFLLFVTGSIYKKLIG